VKDIRQLRIEEVATMS
jgi:hypothetical protein